MRFNLKLFVLVGVFVGLRDVWGVEENEDDVFIVGKWTEIQKKEVKDAMADRRVIIAVYKTEKAGDVSIIHGNFGKNLSKAFVRAGNGLDGVKEVDNFAANSAGRLVHNMEGIVEYTVYFIFKQECFNSKSEGLLVSTALMFIWCASLIHADLRFFNTTNVKNMHEMFGYCSSLKELNLSPSNTTSVEDMSYMFNGCTALTELDLSPFDTQNVTNMRGMFYYCTALTKLDFSKLNTKKVENMSYMFHGCWALTELNLSNFDFSKVNNTEEIFQGCGFEKLYLPQKHAKTRKRCICCGDRYVYINGKAVVEFNPNNVFFVEGE